MNVTVRFFDVDKKLASLIEKHCSVFSFTDDEDGVSCDADFELSNNEDYGNLQYFIDNGNDVDPELIEGFPSWVYESDSIVVNID